MSFYPNLALFLLAISPGLKIVSKGSFLCLSSASTYPLILEYKRQDLEFAPIEDTRM